MRYLYSIQFRKDFSLIRPKELILLSSIIGVISIFNMLTDPTDRDVVHGPVDGHVVNLSYHT